MLKADKSKLIHLRWLIGWLVVFDVQSTADRSFRDGTPHLLSLAKDVKLSFYNVPTGNQTPGRHMAIHYTTAASRQLPLHLRINETSL